MFKKIGFTGERKSFKKCQEDLLHGFIVMHDVLSFSPWPGYMPFFIHQAIGTYAG